MSDVRYRALLKASVLVGYCDSADFDLLKDPAALSRWLKGLKVHVEATGHALADTWAAKPTLIEDQPTNKGE